MTREQLAELIRADMATAGLLGWSEDRLARAVKGHIGLSPDASDREVFRELSASCPDFDEQAAIEAGGDEPEMVEAVGGNGSFELRREGDSMPRPHEAPNLYAKTETPEGMPEFSHIHPAYRGYEIRNWQKAQENEQRRVESKAYLEGLAPGELRAQIEGSLMQDTLDRVETDR